MKTVHIETFDASHDVYGNPTAHYNIWFGGEIILSTYGGKRQQIGYCGRINQAALYELNKLGFNLETANKHFDRNGGSVEYNVNDFDNMQDCFFVEMSDLFCGELNYSYITRFKIHAKTERGAISKLAKYTGLKFRAYIRNEVYHSTSKSTGATIEPFNIGLHSDFEVIEL